LIAITTEQQTTAILRAEVRMMVHTPSKHYESPTTSDGKIPVILNQIFTSKQPSNLLFIYYRNFWELQL
jgi:hypothetical protein